MTTALTPEAKQFIADNYLTMAGTEMALYLGLSSPCPVIRFCRKHGYAIPKEVSFKYRASRMTGKTTSTPEMDEKIKELYLTMPIKTLGTLLGKSGCFLKKRYSQLGLEIPSDIAYQRQMDSRIKPGTPPPNKGQKMEEETKRKIKHTWFPKGHQPKNAKHDGYISARDSKDKTYLHVRTRAGKFDLYHRHMWKQANGEIQEGMIVTFKNGDSTDVRLENLELITRSEHLFRNRYSRYPEEIREAQRALTNLRNTIKNHEKQRSDSPEKSHV